MRGLSSVLRLYRQITQGRFQWFIHLAEPRGRLASVRDVMFFGLCGVRHLVGVPWAAADLHCVSDDSGECEWEAVRLARRVGCLGAVDLDSENAWDLHLTPAENAAAEILLRTHQIPAEFIVMSPGARVEAKDWTEPNWVALMKQLAQARPTDGVVLVGSADEWERAECCLRAWDGPGANLCGRIDHRLCAVMMRRACLFVGHDSGPMHLAAAVGTPCVALFSSRNRPRQWFPRGQGHTILYHPVPCGGCGLSECREFGKRCILTISVEEVFRAIMAQLKQSSFQGCHHHIRSESVF